MSTSEGLIKVTCKYFKENVPLCPEKECIFKLRVDKIYPDVFYGCRKLTIDWVSYIKFKEHVTIYKGDE